MHFNTLEATLGDNGWSACAKGQEIGRAQTSLCHLRVPPLTPFIVTACPSLQIPFTSATLI